MTLTVGDQRGEQFNLLLGFQHRLMGTIEIVEVANQGLNARADLEGFQHVTAYEVGQVAHRFHRHRLVKQLQRLIVLDAKAPAEPGGIGRKAVMQLGPRPAQFLAQLGNVRTEMGEVGGD